MPNTHNIKLTEEEATRVTEVSPIDAYVNLKDDESAVIIDVRTDYEWENIGFPDLSEVDKETHLIQWKVLPDMAENPKFKEELLTKFTDKDIPLYFICRSGGRSYEAACVAAKLGYQKCINIIGGFEGSTNSQGWKYQNLPWRK